MLGQAWYCNSCRSLTLIAVLAFLFCYFVTLYLPWTWLFLIHHISIIIHKQVFSQLLILPKYNPFEIILMMFLYFLGALANDRMFSIENVSPSYCFLSPYSFVEFLWILIGLKIYNHCRKIAVAILLVQENMKCKSLLWFFTKNPFLIYFWGRQKALESWVTDIKKQALPI